MITLPATREQPGEIILSRGEEMEIELRARELAGEAIDNGMADEWIGAAACGEHSIHDMGAVLDVVHAAMGFWASPTIDARREVFDAAVAALRDRYVAACAEEYYAQAWQEYNEQGDDE